MGGRGRRSRQWWRWSSGCRGVTGWRSTGCWCRLASTSVPACCPDARRARCWTCARRLVSRRTGRSPRGPEGRRRGMATAGWLPQDGYRRMATAGWLPQDRGQDAKLLAVLGHRAACDEDAHLGQPLGDLLVGEGLLFVLDDVLDHILRRKRGSEEVGERDHLT